jgi:hypothetical protein
MIRSSSTTTRDVASSIIASILLFGCGIQLTPQNAGGQTAASTSVAAGQKHRQCRAGQDLDANTANDTRNQWSRSYAAISGEARNSASTTFACTTLRSFAHDCPAWDPEAPALAVRACRLDLELQQAEVDKQLRRLTTGDASNAKQIELRDGTMWPEGDAREGLLVAMARLRDLGADDDESRAALAKAEQLRDDVLRVNDAVSNAAKLDGSCADLTKLSEMAKESKGSAREFYDNAYKSKRAASTATLDKRLQEIIGAKVDVAQADLTRLRAQLNDAKQISTELGCIQKDPATVSKVESWAANRETEIAAEEKCRASDPCMGERLVADLCFHIEGKKEAAARVAQIRRDGARFGVVNLADLHEAGEDVRFHEERYKEKSKAYTTMTKKQFAAAKCKALMEASASASD